MADKKVKVRIQLAGGGIKWVDAEVLERLQKAAADFIAQSGAIGFTAFEVIDEADQVRDIFVDEVAKP